MAARQTRTPSSSTLVIEENPNGSGTGRSRIVPEIRPGRRGISRGGREVDGVQGGLFPYKSHVRKRTGPRKGRSWEKPIGCAELLRDARVHEPPHEVVRRIRVGEERVVVHRRRRIEQVADAGREGGAPQRRLEQVGG